MASHYQSLDNLGSKTNPQSQKDSVSSNTLNSEIEPNLPKLLDQYQATSSGSQLDASSLKTLRSLFKDTFVDISRGVGRTDSDGNSTRLTIEVATDLLANAVAVASAINREGSKIHYNSELVPQVVAIRKAIEFLIRTAALYSMNETAKSTNDDGVKTKQA